MKTVTQTKRRLSDLIKQDLSFKGETSHPAHNTHAFAAKFPAQLPRLFIESLTKPGDVVLDPISGSGTALVEAALLGRTGIGTDMDMLAVKLSRVKTSVLDLPLVRLTINQIVSTVDLIVTSPPYANAIDYMRAHKFSLYWLGLDYDYLAELRKRYIGAEVRQSLESFPHRLASQIVKSVSEKDLRKAGILLRYFRDMERALSEMHHVLKPGKSAVIVVGSSTIRGIDILTHEVIGEMAQAVGFNWVGMVHRNIDRDKRLMPMGFKTNRNGIEARMNQEYVILLHKP